MLGINLGIRDAKQWIDSSPLLTVVPLMLELLYVITNFL